MNPRITLQSIEVDLLKDMKHALDDHKPRDSGDGFPCYELRRAALLYLAWTFLLLVASVIAGCSNVPREPDRADDRGAAIARAAAQLVGTPYHFGGADAEGFDCSGLVAYVHQRAGLEVPRSADEQRRAAHPVALDAVLPGDVVFFRTRFHIGSRVDHVGIYTGSGRFIHAPRSGGTVSYASLTEGYYRKHLVSAGRFWSDLRTHQDER